LRQNQVPVEIRKIIFFFYRQDIDDSNIHNAVDLWCSDNNERDKTYCILHYGHISDWDTSKVIIKPSVK
jgi:hypothetical protein